MKFKNHYNASQFKDHNETNTKPSVTIPDMSMSIRQIMDRYARGLPLGGIRVPVYDGDEDFYPDPKTMDISERAEFIQQKREELAQLNRDLEEKQKQNNEAATKLRKEEIEKKLQEREDNAAAKKRFAQYNREAQRQKINDEEE